jgi:hypothetical protein
MRRLVAGAPARLAGPARAAALPADRGHVRGRGSVVLTARARAIPHSDAAGREWGRVPGARRAGQRRPVRPRIAER